MAKRKKTTEQTIEGHPSSLMVRYDPVADKRVRGSSMLIMPSDQATWQELQQSLLHTGEHSLLQMPLLRAYMVTRR